MHHIWTVFLYQPLQNILAVLVSIVPGSDLGVAVIVLTLLVKTLLFPLSQKSIESQVKMNLLAPELKKIKDSGLNKEEQAKKQLELYSKHKANPATGCVVALIQIPIVLALYYVFLHWENFDTSLLYSFVHIPTNVNNYFLGILDISKNHIIILAILAGISQFLQAHYMPKLDQNNENTRNASFQESFSKNMQMQMKYVFPFVVALIAYSISGAIALYWITSNIFAVGQQIYAERKRKRAQA